MIKVPFKLPIGSTFFPSAGQQFEGYWNKQYSYVYSDKQSYSSNWYKQDSFFHYPYMLSNAFYKINDFQYREHRGFPRDGNHILIGDSGGFQILSYSKKNIAVSIEPVAILRWLEANCDISMNLDVPVSTEFHAPLKQSIENFRTFESSRQNYDMMLCNILHGRSYSELKTWYDAVKGFDFDGWAIGVKPTTNIYLQLFAFLVLHKQDAKGLNNYCHFFGVASPRNMIMLALLGKHFDTPVGFDASSYNIGSTSRKMFAHNDIQIHYLMGSKNNNQKLSGLVCDCPVCKVITIEDLYKDTWESGLLLSLHNLYQMIETNRIIHCLVSDRKNLNKYIFKMIKNDLRIAKHVNDIMADYEIMSLDNLYEKYKYLLIESSQSSRNCNLSGFV